MPDDCTRSFAADALVTCDLTSDPDAPVAPAGSSAERYVLGAELARGGMGVVYRATDAVLRREVAVKVLQPRFAAGSAAAARFADEGRITAQLQHPGIPPVHDLGVLPDGRPYLAMKLIRGDTLDALLSASPDASADRGRFLAAFEAVCQAVAFAHARGVIHRDLKPANVMVGAFGEVQVMDWGLAKVLGETAAATDPDVTSDADPVHSLRDPDGSFTQAGSVLGTPAFMPPEQALGAVNKVGARSDVFGLGAVLAVVLTGEPPFAAGGGETTRLQAAQGRLDDCFARLDASGADPGWVALGKRCLAPDPAARPADAGEVAVAAARLRQAADERARRAELDRVAAEGEKVAAEVRASEQRKRRHAQAALGVAFTALVALGLGFAWWADHQAGLRAADARDRQAAETEEHARRAAETTAGVDRAFEEAVAGFGRARGAGRDLGSWGEAEAAAAHAARLAEADGVPADRRERVGRHRAEVGRAVYALRFVAALAEIQAGMGDRADDNGQMDVAVTDDMYRRAFGDAGLDPLADPPARTAARLRAFGEEFRLELAAAVDNWGYVRFMLSGRLDGTARLFGVTRELDPDPVRNRVRELVAGRDAAGLARAADGLDPAREPAVTINLLAVYLHWFGDDAADGPTVRLYRRALLHHPGDFQINGNLSHILTRAGAAAEALAYSRAALAVRPRSAGCWLSHGRLLDSLDRPAEAADAYRVMLRLTPDSLVGWTRLRATATTIGRAAEAPAASETVVALLRAAARRHPAAATYPTWLGGELVELGRTDEAVAAYREAARRGPADPANHRRLAALLRQAGDAAGAEAALAEARRLDPAAGGPVAAGFARRLLGHSGIAYGVVFAPDGRLTSSAADGTVRVWSGAGGGTPLTLSRGNGERFRSHAVRADPADRSRWQVLAGTFEGRVVVFTPPHDGSTTWSAAELPIDAGGKSINALAVTPDGRYVLAGTAAGLAVWDFEAKTARALPSPDVLGIAVRPDGKQAAVTSTGGRLELLDLTTWIGRAVPGAEAVDGVAYRPDGCQLAVAGAAGLIRLIDPDGGRAVRVLTGHTGVVVGLAFAPGGRVLVSGSHDHTVRLWDAETGDLLHTFYGHTQFVRHVAVDPDGRTVASAGWDYVVGEWELPPHIRPLVPTTRPTAPPPREVGR